MSLNCVLPRDRVLHDDAVLDCSYLTFDNDGDANSLVSRGGFRGDRRLALVCQLVASDRLERWLSRRSSFRTSRSVSTREVASRLPPISIADSDDEDALGGWVSPVSLSPGSQDKLRRCWRLVLEGDGPLSMGRDIHISLAQRTRSADCRPPSLVSPGEEEAYAKVVTASSKFSGREAFNEFTVTMEDRIRALRNESEVEKGKAEVRRLTEELRVVKEETRKKTGEAMLLKDEWQRARRERAAFETEVAALGTKVAELEAGRDRDIQKRWVGKKKEESAEIQLHEVVANLDLLNEIKKEGLVVDEEIIRLKEMVKDCEAIASLAAVPDWSVAGLDLPQVSEDSVVNDEAADSSSGEGVSS
ncbi:hypothetical protein DY000_02008075 [Brassica cretica]|uniref:Uncharacterized protein n=1 Tax=Brassica cretica TaxID=69181 RepID=A0ABQ7BVE9_BRACR|nr:hypothetical protein DY000_02008075 [Brassica cretica]